MWKPAHWMTGNLDRKTVEHALAMFVGAEEPTP